jgi:hypothetical protein
MSEITLDGADGPVVLTGAEAGTLIRLAAAAIEENDIDAALRSFGDPTKVEALAMRVARDLFYGADA